MPSAAKVTGAVAEDTAGTDVAGADVIRGHLRTLPGSPGIYQMFDAAGDVLYVGKAKNLKNRVSSYVRGRGLTTRIQKMVQATRRLEVVTTHTEVEALLLESNLIKRHRPPFKRPAARRQVVPLYPADRGRHVAAPHQVPRRPLRQGRLLRPLCVGRIGQPYSRLPGTGISAAVL